MAFASALSLVYDANGNLVTGDGKYRTYDGFNHLVQVRNGDNATATILENYTWHPIEDRILAKSVYETNGSWKEDVLYISKEYVIVDNASGSFDYRYYYQNGQLVAQQNPDGSKLFFHNDNLGSVGLVTNESGAKVEETFYDPFGEIISGGDASRYDYTGKEYDSVTGDYDFNARMYNPSRITLNTPDLTIPDVYNPQTLNRYSYVNNNPYSYTDPNGKAAIWIHWSDTFSNYLSATYDPILAWQMAAGAVEPDLYRYKDNPLSQATAKILGLDLEMDVEGPAAELYYHEGKDLQGNKVDLGGSFKQALSKGNIQTMGNLEHGLGADVGSGGVAGYHQREINGISNSRLNHFVNDMFSTYTDRSALNKVQYERARQTLPLSRTYKAVQVTKNTVSKTAQTIKQTVKSIIRRVTRR